MSRDKSFGEKFIAFFQEGPVGNALGYFIAIVALTVPLCIVCTFLGGGILGLVTALVAAALVIVIGALAFVLAITVILVVLIVGVLLFPALILEGFTEWSFLWYWHLAILPVWSTLLTWSWCRGPLREIVSSAVDRVLDLKDQLQDTITAAIETSAETSKRKADKRKDSPGRKKRAKKKSAKKGKNEAGENGNEDGETDEE